MDLTETIAPRSDQINAEDLLTGPRTITITDVKKGNDEQPVNIVTAEFGPARPYKPSKTMRRVIIAAWGSESSAYIGRRLTIYRDPEVTFGRDKVGGIKISHMSHIDRKVELALTVTRGRRAIFTALPLPDEPAPQPATKGPNAASIIGAFDALKVTVEQLEKRIGRPHDAWTADDLTALAAIGKAIKEGKSTTYEEFDTADEPQQGELGDES